MAPGRTNKPSGGGAHATPASNFDMDDFQTQLWELCEDSENITQMQTLVTDAKKTKLSSEDRTVLNVVGLIAPFMVSARAVADSLGAIKETIDKNKKNIRLLAYAQEKLEQYTRRDNLRLFNFPACEDSGLRAKFIELAQVLGVTVQESDINVIHHLQSRSPNKPVIVRLNNRHMRNQILYAKKTILNSDECPFKGVYVQEDLTVQRSKMFRYLKGLANVERVRTSEGRLQVTLKLDKGSGKKVTVENPDDLFRVGVDLSDADIVEFGYKDI